MSEINKGKVKNTALVSHPGAGKTSLIDMLAYSIGVVDRLGRAEEGSSISDYNEDEKKRGMSIDSSIFTFKKDDAKINIIDTPGYLEFIGEVVSSLKIVDSGLILIDATNGIELGTGRVWSLLKEREMACGIFINKINEESGNLNTLINDLKENFGKECVLFEIPNSEGKEYKFSTSLLKEEIDTEIDLNISSLKQDLIESIAESKDELVEKYLEKGTLSDEEITQGLKSAISKREIIPVFCGSSQNAEYVKGLFDFIMKFFPSASGIKEVQGRDKQGEEVRIDCKRESPFCSQVFKTVIDPYIGQLSIFRIYSGEIEVGDTVENVSANVSENIGKLYILQGEERREINKASVGEIVGVAKLKNTNVSDTLCNKEREIILPEIKFPEPLLSISITPESREGEKKISQALQKITREDGTIQSSRDKQTNELIVSGMGNLHLEIMVDRLKERFGVNVKIGTPAVPYKETITCSKKVQYRHKKQSGGRGQYGEVYIEFQPLEKESDFEFINNIKGGAVPKRYIPAVEKGIRNTLQEGVLAGFPVVDVKAVLYDGSSHSVDSSDMAFQIAGSMATTKAVKGANPVLLEPIMDVTITVESDFMGEINKDMSSRRGKIMGMEPKGSLQSIKAKVPLSEMLKYASELKSITGGRGTFTMEFSHYEQLPHNLAQKVIAQKKNEQKEKKK